MKRLSLAEGGRVLLADLMLKGDSLEDSEYGEELLKRKVERICSFCKEKNVKLFLCQKVIGSTVEDVFRYDYPNFLKPGLDIQSVFPFFP